MLCCVGLFGGLYVGQALGGPWTLVAPAAGFGLGLIGDMKLMRHTHACPWHRSGDARKPGPDVDARPAHATSVDDEARADVVAARELDVSKETRAPGIGAGRPPPHGSFN